MNDVTEQLSVIGSGAMLTKQDLKNSAYALATRIIESGAIDSLDLQIRMKRAQTFLQELEKAMEEHVLAEAEMQDGKEFEKDGAKISIREVGVKYNYDTDERWKYLKSLENDCAERRKEHENLLRSLKERLQVIDEETGEVREHKPVGKTSKTKAVITIK